MATFGANFIIIDQTWTQLKSTLDLKQLSLQCDAGNSQYYQLFALEDHVVYLATIFRGTVPDSIAAYYSQTQNDLDKADYEGNYSFRSNYPIERFQNGDPRWVHKLGNAAYTMVSESLVFGRLYVEPPSQGQRSVVSTSANDINPNGSGAKKVRIIYLNSNYVKKIEEVALSGTNAVNTVNTDIRFIEDFYVIAGAAAVGAVRLMSATNGTGTEICGIGSGAESAFLCQHYVPSGSEAQVVKWGATVSDDALMRLKGQRWVSGSLVDINLDLDMMTGITSGSRSDFERTFSYMPVQEKTKIQITAQPGQSTSTTVRARLDIWEDSLYVSGTT